MSVVVVMVLLLIGFPADYNNIIDINRFNRYNIIDINRYRYRYRYDRYK